MLRYVRSDGKIINNKIELHVSKNLYLLQFDSNNPNNASKKFPFALVNTKKKKKKKKDELHLWKFSINEIYSQSLAPFSSFVPSSVPVRLPRLSIEL